MRRGSFRLGTKLYSSVTILALVALAIAAIGIDALRTYHKDVAEMRSISERALLAQKINAGITAAVMESRGIFLTDSAEHAEKFAAPMEADLTRIKQSMTDWLGLVPAELRPKAEALSSRIDDFIAQRREMLRFTRDGNIAQARVIGDNEQGRAARQALNADLQAVADRHDREVGEAVAALDTSYQDHLNSLIVITVLGLLAGLGLTVFIVRVHVVGPVQHMTSTMRVLAGGDLSIAIPHADWSCEIGEMAQAVQVFKDSANEVADLRRAQEETAARTARERRQTMLQLADGFQDKVMAVVQRVSTSAEQLTITAKGLSATAQQTNAQASDVAVASQQATDNVNSVASAAEQLNSSIDEIGRRVAQAAKISKDASDETVRTNTMVQALSASADRISEVVRMINDIASQTNLLALNATIEAARAGDAGKGFAVVANEVKSLANQTARATEDITGQIASVQEETRRAVEAIRSIGKVIEEVRDISTGIASAVDEQGAATREIARNVQEAASGTGHVAATIGGISQATAETQSSAEHVLTSADDLTANSATLRSAVDSFLASVRTA